jgi:hypothetical protein
LVLHTSSPRLGLDFLRRGFGTDLQLHKSGNQPRRIIREAVWEGNDLAERTGEFQQAIGASYEISPQMSVGLELLHELVFPGWNDDRHTRNVFVGPNVSYRRGSWFVTVTGLVQATSTEGEPDFQLRTIFGIAL